MNVLCVTPNVSIDRTLEVPGFTAGGVWRAETVDIRCGGKGVNVARALLALGQHASCSGIVGGHTGRLAAASAAAEGLQAAWTWTDHESRTCVIIVGAGGAASVINEPGPAISAGDWNRFLADAALASASADAVAISGSFPPRTPEGGLRALIARVGREGCPVWVDCSGDVLAELVAGAPPACLAGIKINDEEAAGLVGEPIISAQTAVIAAETLRRRGPHTIVITMGADGAVLVSEGRRLWARPPAISAASAVGSGDCFLAGLIAGWHECGSDEDALLLATAAGAANALGTTVGLSTADVARLLAETTLTAVSGAA